MPKQVKVLVVDDSPLILQLIQDLLEESSEIQVVGTASNGADAIRMAAKLNPDVVTLDVQMPKMDGIETLTRLLKQKPIPVIMVSASTQLGGQITLEALEQGAIDYIAKPEGLRQAETTLREELIRKIMAASHSDVGKILEIRRRRAAKRQQSRASKPSIPQSPRTSQSVQNEVGDRCIAIGISTGGPPALAGMFENLPGNLPPIVIVQHMPENFTKAFANRLDLLSEVNVKEAESGDVLRWGHAYLAPGGKHMEVLRYGADGGKLRIFNGDPVSGHRPSVDVMMNSVAKIFGSRVLGVVMTGMGRDGSDGCKAIQAAGGYTLGQDEATSDVYGMNKVAFVEGNVHKQFALHDAPTVLCKNAQRVLGGAKVAT